MQESDSILVLEQSMLETESCGVRKTLYLNSSKDHFDVCESFDFALEKRGGT